MGKTQYGSVKKFIRCGRQGERLGCTWVAGGEKKAYLNRIGVKPS